MPNWITSESPTIRPEQLRENIRKATELIRRPWYEGIKSWASCHHRTSAVASEAVAEQRPPKRRNERTDQLL